MIERVDRTQRELNVALGIDVVGHAQHHFADVLHVAVFIHHDDALGKHRLPQRPDGVHHLARLARIALADRHQHQVVKDRLDGQMNVDDFRNRHLHRGQKDALHGLAHPRIFHRRLAHDRRRINGILAMRDAGEVKDRVLIRHRVEAGVVAEGTFAAQLAQFDVAFEHDLGVRRNFEIDGFALHNLDGLAAQESGDHELLDFRRRRHDGRKRGRRIGADGHRNFKPRALQIAQRHLRQPADRAVGNGDRAAGRLGHRGHARRFSLIADSPPQPPRCAALRGNAPPPPSAAASACRWSGRRTPACDTCRCCACRCADRAYARTAA